VTEELSAHRVGDDGSLITDDRLGDIRSECVRANRTKHPACRDDDANIRCPRGRDRGVCPRAQFDVGGDERPVEVARERLYARWELCRKLEAQLPAAVET
jgi:hypothetical protein